MPKMKPHKGAKARFRVTGTGKLVRAKQGKNHIMKTKSPRRVRRLTGNAPVSAADAPRISRMLARR